MTFSEPARREPARPTTRRIPRLLVAGLLAVIAAIAAAPGYHSLASTSTTAASPLDAPSWSPPTAFPDHGPPREQPGPPGEGDGVLRPEHRRALGEADGAVPDATTVFENDVAAVAKLDPALLGAVRRAATAAAADRVTFVVNSGWRSHKYQEQLLQDAVSKYGTVAEAARWVATPDTSTHVSGDALDIGPSGATAWLARHGARYGLCQIYRNEPWHYELRPDAIDDGCPRMYADPTDDPRMQR